MANAQTAVFGTFPNTFQADGALDALLVAHLVPGSISVLMPDYGGADDEAQGESGDASEVPTEVAARAGGGTSRLLDAGGPVGIQGMRPLVAAGPIVADIASLGVKASAGGFVGTLVRLGVPEYAAKRYESRMWDGHLLVSVRCDSADDLVRTTEAFARTGARDVAFANEDNLVSPAMAQCGRRGY